MTAKNLEGVTLVVAATPDDEVNRQVAADAGEHRIPVNVVDCPELCSFVFPSIRIDRHWSSVSPAVQRARFWRGWCAAKSNR